MENENMDRVRTRLQSINIISSATLPLAYEYKKNTALVWN
jgi:hypothetical protein